MLNEKIFTDEKEKHYKTHCKKNFLGMKNMQIINIYHTPRKFERRKIISTYEIKFLNFNVKKNKSSGTYTAKASNFCDAK